METFKKNLRLWLEADQMNKWSFTSSERLRKLCESLPSEVNMVYFMDTLNSRPLFNIDEAYNYIVNWVDTVLGIAPKEPLTPEEIKNKVSLTASQKVIISQINSLLKMAMKEGVEIIFDEVNYAFAAINAKEIAELQDGKESDNSICIEDYIDWDNLTHSIFWYCSSDGIHAVFK